MIGNDQRGIRLEGILTRLRLAEVRGERVPRFVLLSAVLSNADALANWIGIEPTNIIRGTWRPSAKRLLRWTEDGTLRLHAGDDPLRDIPSEVLGETPLPWPNAYFYSTSNFGAIRQQEPQALENVAFLADFQHKQYQQPCYASVLRAREPDILPLRSLNASYLSNLSRSLSGSSRI